MAAREDQPEPVVLHGDLLRISALVLLVSGADLRGKTGLRDMLLSPQLIDGLPPRGNGQPRARLGRHAVGRPCPGGRGERLGYGVLGRLQVTEPPPQRGHDGRPLVPVRALQRDRCYSRGARHAWPSSTGRTSTVP